MSTLYDRQTIERLIDEGMVPRWQRDRYETFHDALVDDASPFPCYFATRAHLAGDLRYGFPAGADTAVGRDQTGDLLASFLDVAPTIDGVTSLAVLFEPPTGDRSPAWYKRQFWGLLQHLHDHDPAPWPDGCPADPADPEFAFCFAGEPIFVVARAPFYERRRSRHTPHGLEVTIQPRSVFDGIEAETPAGDLARSVIRDRLESYDEVDQHPDIGDYGDEETREWKQYMLPETNAESTARFPVEIEVD